MIQARLSTRCPGCSDDIAPGDMIGQIGLAYYCAPCFNEFERENAASGETMRLAGQTYPISGQWEPA